jgi:hypothetical protein
MSKVNPNSLLLGANLIALVFIFGFAFQRYALPGVALAIYKTDYKKMVFECDNVMRDISLLRLGWKSTFRVQVGHLGLPRWGFLRATNDVLERVDRTGGHRRSAIRVSLGLLRRKGDIALSLGLMEFGFSIALVAADFLVTSVRRRRVQDFAQQSLRMGSNLPASCTKFR